MPLFLLYSSLTLKLIFVKDDAKRSRKTSAPLQRNVMVGSNMQAMVQQVGQGAPQMQTPYPPNNNMPGQFMSPMMSGQQQEMQPAYQQFGNTMQMQYQNNGTGHFMPMMNPAHQQQMGQMQMPQTSMYQQPMQFTSNPYMQQTSPNFQNMHAQYYHQQFHNNMQWQSMQASHAQPQPHPMNRQAQMNYQALQLPTRDGVVSQEPGKGLTSQEQQSKPPVVKNLTKEKEHHTPKQKSKVHDVNGNSPLPEKKAEEAYALDTDADANSQSSSDDQGKVKPSQRSGKFTQEEDDYCRAAISDFELGVLDALPGQNICAYLAKKLNCSYIRIIKKYKGVNRLDCFQPLSIKGSDEETEIKVEKARVSCAGFCYLFCKYPISHLCNLIKGKNSKPLQEIPSVSRKAGTEKRRRKPILFR